MTWQDALKMGLAQVLALLSGTSRSGATIIGGMLFGIAATSCDGVFFFLAVPTMFAAAFYDLYKHRALFSWMVLLLDLLRPFVVRLLLCRVSSVLSLGIPSSFLPSIVLPLVY